MGLFQGLFEIAMIPVAVVKDVVTMAGAMTDNPEPYTKEQMRTIEEAFEE